MLSEALLMLCMLAGFFGPLALITAIVEMTIWRDKE